MSVVRVSVTAGEVAVARLRSIIASSVAMPRYSCVSERAVGVSIASSSETLCGAASMPVGGAVTSRVTRSETVSHGAAAIRARPHSRARSRNFTEGSSVI